jgi:hypothetical protein
MQVAEDFQGIDPGFHLSALVTQETSLHSDDWKKFPGANRAGEFQGWLRFRGAQPKWNGQKAQPHNTDSGDATHSTIATIFHLVKGAGM